MSLGDISADKLGTTTRATMAGTFDDGGIAKLAAEGATLSFEHTDLDGATRSIEVDLSNVTDHDSLASALNASLNGLGVEATAAGAFGSSSTVTLSGSILSGETLTAAAFEIDGTTAIAPSVAVAVSATTADTKVDDIDISTAVGSSNALAIIDNALGEINESRADLGALQNRFGHTISNLANIQENVSASRSRIQDTDFATETANMTKNQILQQAGTSILSQANQLPQAALSLLG
ncbi:flagellin FliC [Pseudoalteromonas sp. SG44-5]|nr:flagellin FliC [Pseudoalteromonas sp. SG44-5]